MPTFLMLTEHGTRVATNYTPIKVKVGDAEHTLALHRLPWSTYRVSDPQSGGCVVRNVAGGLLGIRVSERPATLDDIKAVAIEQVQALAKRVGIDAFNATLRTGVTA